MSGKRSASSELNHDNWEKEEDKEEAGHFCLANPEEIQKRVIKTAVRRRAINIADTATSSAQNIPTTFKFGCLVSKNEQDHGALKQSFNSKVPMLGQSKQSSPFAFLATSGNSCFSSTSKPSSFATTSSTTINGCSFSVPNGESKGAVSNENEDKNVKASFPGMKPESQTMPLSINNAYLSEENKTGRSSQFLANMKEINQSFIKWIQNQLADHPTSILTRCFKDYINHVQALFNSEKKFVITDDERIILELQEQVLNEIQILSPRTKKDTCQGTDEVEVIDEVSVGEKQPELVANKNVNFKAEVVDTVPNKISAHPITTFSESSGIANKGAPTFGSGVIKFSHGSGTPFSFTNVSRPIETKDKIDEPTKDDKSDEPPKVEFTQVVEEGSIYSKRCKVFVKKDDSKDYQDRGVGTLYLKPVANTGKTQLIVRADTNLGNLLLNVLLNSEIPIQKMNSKASNTVMLVCIPTPDAKPPPRPVLLRVKTSEDADELIKKLQMS